MLNLPSVQGGAQITIHIRLGNSFGERNREFFPLENRATLQGADEVAKIGYETMVDSCSDDKTGRPGGVAPSRHAPINRGTKRNARCHTGKPTEPLLCETPKRRRQRRELTTFAAAQRASAPSSRAMTEQGESDPSWGSSPTAAKTTCDSPASGHR